MFLNPEENPGRRIDIHAVEWQIHRSILNLTRNSPSPPGDASLRVESDGNVYEEVLRVAVSRGQVNIELACSSIQCLLSFSPATECGETIFLRNSTAFTKTRYSHSGCALFALDMRISIARQRLRYRPGESRYFRRATVPRRIPPKCRF